MINLRLAKRQPFKLSEVIKRRWKFKKKRWPVISHEKSRIRFKNKNVTFETFYTSDLMTGPLG